MSEPTPLPEPSAPAPLSGQEPLFIVFNGGSGNDDSSRTLQKIQELLDGAGRTFTVLAVEDPSTLPQVAERAVKLASDAGGVVVAAGGDGTLNAVAAAVLPSGLPFGILPRGTFNYFGRTYGISRETEESVASLLDARIEPVQVGLLDGRPFLVNASLGLYPQLLEDREAYKQKLGRRRWVALISAVATLMRAPAQLNLELSSHGQRQLLRTPTLVVGNNALQLEQLGLPDVAHLDENRLVAMAAKPVGTLALYWLMVMGALSRLGEAANVISFGFDTLTVRVRGGRRRIKVAMDGEISWTRAPLVFAVSPRRLQLLVPRDNSKLDRA
ncbi:MULTISPECIES: diacylglycerol kinase family protein [unclassified Achromobacter]|uniref:diacylglycerol/lipid kinase family protein n=1 Tax=unclassified Achromobacter TaxID=2626865 RepID=UPI000B51AC66|nr:MULTISPECIES: diacylglycerol kinase family protein [unclassified Achromobacter]OWT80183.1 diacylglycerol kinase [Achromobacter sp. HZ34]OWT82066.1 diacylglycerol kinase [Achromobacter sp. HZ28]